MMNTLSALRKLKKKKGFTLMELMIAVAIVGVLAAIAVPQFTTYLARARVAEAVNYAQACKTGFVEFHASSGTFPASVAQAACTDITTENIQSVSVNGGTAPRIVVSLVNAAPLPAAIRNHHIILQPLAGPTAIAVAGGRILNWRCSVSTAATGNAAAATAALDLVPTACRQAPL